MFAKGRLLFTKGRIADYILIHNVLHNILHKTPHNIPHNDDGPLSCPRITMSWTSIN